MPFPSSTTIQDLENLLIDYVYQDQWNERWDGETIPADLMKSYIAHAKKLSELFTKNRENINARYFRKTENRYAYIFYFHISSVMRAYHVMAEMLKRGIWPSGASSFMDLGSGSGGSLWALGLHQKKNGFPIENVYALDQDPHVLKDAKKLWKNFTKKFEIEAPGLEIIKQDLMNVKKFETDEFYHKIDIVFCSNVLNEFSKMSDASKLTLFKTIALHVLNKNGMLVLIEPALSETTRQLMQLRDLFLENIAADVPIPCGHQASCPMLKDPKEWCHFQFEWEPPKMRHKIEKALGFHSGILKYSYLVFRKKELDPPRNESSRKQYRVLSPALKNEKGFCVLLCAEEDVLSLYFDKQHKDLMKIQRGQILELGPLETTTSTMPFQKAVTLGPESHPKIL